MSTDLSTMTPPARLGCSVVEFRQYTLRPGMRDVMIELFDREFVETQEALEMAVIGQFRDLDDSERFVWLRGFADMEVRQSALTEFYDGPVWAAHRDAARATMVDTDDVLLLRPAVPASGFALTRLRPPRSSRSVPPTLVTATIHYPDGPADGDFLAFHEPTVAPVLRRAGAAATATLVTERSANTYPRLPVREGENVLVRLATFFDRAAYDRHLDALARSAAWRDASAALEQRVARPSETLRLIPTARSAL